MITSHHSFSTRIFLQETSAVHASVVTPAAESPDNLREFWWFLRNAHPQSREVISAQRHAPAGGSSFREAVGASASLSGARPSISSIS